MDYETRLELYSDTLHGFVKAEIENDNHVTLKIESVRDFFENLQDMVNSKIIDDCFEEANL